MRSIVCVSLVATACFAQSTKIDFTRDIEPVLRKKCQVCHGAQQQMNGLRLDDGEAALRGGYSGPVIVPGKSAASKLIERVSSTKKDFMMPPAGERVSPAEIDRLRAWIDQGASWPASAAKTQARPKSAHWAFQPVARAQPPSIQNRNWVRNPIDQFVLARLEADGITPSPDAGRLTLLRRVKLDLTGLPPSPEEVAEFLNDNRADAYEQLVERLLALPHYGEKWARHWLDLARYADSDGYEKDQSRPYAWRWRNWVIDALNRDMPFDQFTTEQIAGDLLPNATVEQRVATGFHRNTLTNREAGVSRVEARFEQVLNRANTVGTVWLGLTVGCAQCHDHKYDPISQKEYYQFFAFFNGAEDEFIEAPLPGEMGPFLQARPEYDKKRAELLAEYKIPELQIEWERRIRVGLDTPGKDLEFDFSLTSMRAMFDHAEKILRMPPEKRTARQSRRLTDYFINSPGPAIARDKELTAKFKELREKLGKLNETLPALTEAQILVDDPQSPKTHIAIRGDYRNPGIEVQPGVLAILPSMKPAEAPRLDLARWLTSADNPLTARVAVNRMWQEFFGRGLSRTADDFGTQGEKPTHPELLDWLARQFMERGWSMKQMHRLIVTSATYRQSSNARPEIDQRDPDNTLLARQKRLRLPAESIRDSALYASGLLNTAIGGRSVRPPIPAGVVELGYANSVKWNESQGPDRYRRGLYIHFQRTTPYPQLMNFDAPDSNVTCARRRTSNTPLQALNLLNDPVFVEAAQALAVRLLQQTPQSVAARLDKAFLLCLGRRPSGRERERLAKYVDEQAGADSAWTGVARILLNLDEFITRE